MIYSENALKILVGKEIGIIKSNAQFYREYPTLEDYEKEYSNNPNIKNYEKKIKKLFLSDSNIDGMICAYDNDFPIINKNTNAGDKPYLLFYKGDIDLLKNLNNNVAVIGLINPTETIELREAKIIENLVKRKVVIISGLALGCDTIAHRNTIINKGKTIAVLPSTINRITPSENKDLANMIVKEGGLLLTEYYKEPSSRYEAINRYIERDRLQALFAKAIILIASYRRGQGDSGSRHAMNFAKKIGIKRYVMFNDETDSGDEKFQLNKDILSDARIDVDILTATKIEEIVNLYDDNLRSINKIVKQLTLF